MEAPILVDFWHWWVLAVLMLILEMILPSFFALWLGVGAFLTGLLLWFFPELSWNLQLLCFAVLTVLSAVCWRWYYRQHPIESAEPTLNRRGDAYLGQVVTLSEPIVDGHGKVKLDDSTWKISGTDCPAGTKVRLTRLNNVIFEVELVAPTPSDQREH